LFQRKRMAFIQILPLALAVILSVVLTNASLAFSSIQFYQIMRVAVTPCVAVVNWIILKKTIPLMAGLTLIPVCIGVAIVSYFDTAASAASHGRGTSPLGVIFALISLGATAVYTVLIKKFHETTDCKSHQLLLNQSPVAVLIMLYIIPFSDDVTHWGTVSMEIWIYILVVRGPTMRMIMATDELPERHPCVFASHLTIHDHRRRRTSQQYSSGSFQDLPDHRDWMGSKPEAAYRREYDWHCTCSGRYRCVCLVPVVCENVC